MPQRPFSTPDPESLVYRIRIKGHLDHRWDSRFEGLRIDLEGNGYTTLTGMVADQAALHGLLRKIRDIALPLISVMPVESGWDERDTSISDPANAYTTRYRKAEK